MLHRQRVILELMRRASGPVGRLQLTKWCFLLREESESAGGSAFYDFLPYKYGPFSFALYQELDKLVAQNYIEPIDDQQLRLSELGESEATVVGQTSRDLSRVMTRFGKTTTAGLLDYVYEKYPSYTVNSQRKRMAKRPTVKPAVYTAGYEGRSIDRFLGLLMESDIERLVDVRKNPIARRYGFHKSTLDRLCGKLDIEYVHVPELGIDGSKRQSLDSRDDYDRLFDDYETTTLTSEDVAIDHVVAMVAAKPSVLVCMEADHCFCHRSRLADEVAKRSGLTIKHLG